MNRFSLTELNFDTHAIDRDRLTDPAHHMHFDTSPIWIVDRAMFERARIEPPPELTIDAIEQIQIEPSRHALRVVVGRLEHGGVLPKVDPHEQTVVR